jgi:antitoxin (DNA-binding transcriptional repressor) of toxin-antitoxin stability system
LYGAGRRARNPALVKNTKKIGKYRDILTRIKEWIKIDNMKALTVAEVKTHFSDILFQVQNGERVKILYGKSRKPIAMIIPFEDTNIPRKIGVLDGIASYKEDNDGKISLEEFLGL